MISVKECKSKRDMKIFATWPIKLYKDCPYYVPSIVGDEKNLLSKKKNLMLGTSETKCFLAYKDNKVVGRICAIICHESNEKNNEKAIRFSRIDMIDDIEVTKALLQAVIDWGKEKGMERIEGPWGFNDTDREGLLTEGFDEFSSYATFYSYPYYAKHLEQLGYKKQSEWEEYRLTFKKIDPRFHVASEMLRKRGYRNLTDNMNVKQIVKKYGDKFFECYNRSYADLDNFIPVDERAKKQTLKQFATLLNPHFFSCIVNDKDEMVAFGVGLPYIGDALRKAKGRMLFAALPILKAIKKPRKVELALIGVDPECRNSGVHAIVIDHFTKYAFADKIEDMFFDPILTTNIKMLNNWKGMDRELRAKRQTYVKSID